MPSRYPERPVLGVGAVLFRGDEVLLVRRRHPPRQGGWSFPGGRLELGERLEEGLKREVLEETGFEVEVSSLLDLYQYVERDGEAKVLYHYCVADYLCRYVTGELEAGSDVEEAKLVAIADLDRYHLNPEALKMIRDARALSAKDTPGISVASGAPRERERSRG